MNRHEKIKASYRALGGGFANLYDGIITRSTLIGKLMDSLVWGLDASLAAKRVNDALAPIPDGFRGTLLEVPVGTGVLTVPVYQSLPDAKITCLDYSAEMMKNAERRAEALAVQNITFVQGDVGALPFEDESFDVVLSLNGFHAFPDKDAAFKETHRVLKKDGIFCGCFYIAGAFGRTDWFVKHMYVPKGFFTPPFETKETLEKRLEDLYAEVRVSPVRAEGVFCCVK